MKLSIVKLACGAAMLLAPHLALGQPTNGGTSAPPAVVTITTLIPTNTFGVGLTNGFGDDETNGTDGAVFEPGAGTFEITRTEPLTNDLTVFYTIGGTAVNGLDYETITNNVTLPAGTDTATITINPILTNTSLPVAFNSTVDLALTPPPADTAYTIGSPSNAVVTIADVVASQVNETNTVEIVAPEDRAAFPEGTDILLAAVASSSTTVTNGVGSTNQPPFVTDNLSVTNVQFFANTTSLGSATPIFLAGTDGESVFGSGILYALEWPAVAAGNYFITAVARDANGGIKVSEPVRVVVRPREPGL
jgi:hypothetical protein